MAKKKSKKVIKTKKKSKSVSKLGTYTYKDNRFNRKLGRVGETYKVGKKTKFSVSKGVSPKSKVTKGKKSKKGSSAVKKGYVGGDRYTLEERKILKAMLLYFMCKCPGLIIGPYIAKKLPPITERERNRDKFFKRDKNLYY